MNFFGHKLGHDKAPQTATNPAEVAAAEAAANIAAAPVAETSADFQVPTTESEHVVTDEAVKEAMGAAASLLDTTEAQANGTMDVVPAPAETVSEATYEGQVAHSLSDAADAHVEFTSAEANGQLDVAPTAPTDGDNEIINGLNLPETGGETGEAAIISSDMDTPSVGAQVDELNTIETEAMFSPEETQGLPAVTENEIIDGLNLPEAGSAESMAILNEADAVAPVADAEAPVTNEQTPEQQ